MPRYVALLRGVSPMNAKMPELKAAFESAGFSNVKTVLASGNVVFDSRSASNASLQKKAEAAMEQSLGRSFATIVRSVAELQALLDADPFAAHKLPKDAKRVVTFLREAPQTVPRLPATLGHARILGMRGTEVLTAYQPLDDTPLFMTLIEKTFGKDVTTRTWDTVAKCAKA
ncbi:MAG: DUF1697 domain-containing protein [Burkholderiales bacterium]|nr:DUF1697 domain-containing protein [Burkholderiales bacterium]